MRSLGSVVILVTGHWDSYKLVIYTQAVWGHSIQLNHRGRFFSGLSGGRFIWETSPFLAHLGFSRHVSESSRIKMMRGFVCALCTLRQSSLIGRVNTSVEAIRSTLFYNNWSVWDRIDTQFHPTLHRVFLHKSSNSQSLNLLILNSHTHLQCP